MKSVERQLNAGKSASSERNQISEYIASQKFAIGDVYLFNKRNPSCPSDSSLWGVFDKCDGGSVYLESSSRDRNVFTAWCRLPDGYRYCRLSTRAEMRQYIFDQTWHERRQMLGAE